MLEVLVTMAVLSIALTLGAQSLRHYWLAQSVPRAADELTVQMRQLQQRAAAQSHPFLFGVRFREGSEEWSVVKYDRKSNSSLTDDVCVEERRVPMAGRVSIAEASFSTDVPIDLSKCPGASGSEFVMFLAKGTATAGGVHLTQAGLDRQAVLCVGGLTARVSERESLGECPLPPVSP